MAEGSGLRLEEVVLLSLHEEIHHRASCPRSSTARPSPPARPTPATATPTSARTGTGCRASTACRDAALEAAGGAEPAGLRLPRPVGGAGLNSAGIALCWTSAGNWGSSGPRVGIPSYVLIAQMLYQDTLQDAVAEARRATQAGWFTFVLADGKGRLANVEGTPERLAVEDARGHLARVGFGSRQMTGTPEGQPVKFHPQCQRMCDLLDGSRGKLDRPACRASSATTSPRSASTRCPGFTLDSMLFDCTTREAYVSRGPGARAAGSLRVRRAMTASVTLPHCPPAKRVGPLSARSHPFPGPAPLGPAGVAIFPYAQ